MRRHHDMGGEPAGPVVPEEHDYAAWEKRVDAYFGDSPPARSTVRAQLVLDGKLEVEAIAYKPL